MRLKGLIFFFSVRRVGLSPGPPFCPSTRSQCVLFKMVSDDTLEGPIHVSFGHVLCVLRDSPHVISRVQLCDMVCYVGIQSCIIFIVQLHSVSVTSSCHKVSYCVIYLICHVIHLVKLHSGFPIIWCSDLSRHLLVASTGPSSFWPWKLPLFSPPFWAASLKGTWRFIVTFWSTHFQETPFFQLSFSIPLIAPKPS